MYNRLFNNRHFLYVQNFLCVVLIFSFVFGNLASVINLPLFEVKKAEAAQVAIDATADITGASHLHGQSQSVFISDQVGYKFYRDSGLNCAYSKTTNGGTSWGAAVSVDAQTDCIGIAVWYDKWTPGGVGSFIHIVTIDTGNDDPWYNRLDTSSDTLLLGSAPVSTILGPPAQGANTFVAGATYPAITKGTDGTVYVAISDNVDSYVVECTTTCQTAANWTETGITPLALTPDFNLLVPLAGGNIMLINRLIASEDIRSKIWNNVAWDLTWSTFEGNATDNTTYDVGMAAVVSSSTPSRVYLAYTASNATLGTDDEIRTRYYNGTSWATTTPTLTGSTTIGITNVAIGLDTSGDGVYVAYTARATAATVGTGRVWWKSSTDNMTAWGTARGPINTTPSDMYGVDINGASDQRIYATWFDNTADIIYGDTIADVFPGVHATTTGSHRTSITASTSNFYVGGTFALSNNYKAFPITGITINENGTINGSTNLSNIKLRYDMDTTAPYNCASESYVGTETQYGATDTNGFSGADGLSSFTGSVVASTTATMCVYAVMDVLNSTANNATIDLTISNPATDIIVTGPQAGPSGVAQPMAGAVTVLNDNLTQSRFHWRNDNGSETTATSRSLNNEGVTFGGYQRTPVRLRMEVSNEGGTTSPPIQYRLETSLATTTCTVATQWRQVGSTGSNWNMFNSSNLTDGANTSNIAITTGGVTDDNPTFKTGNTAVKDTSSQTGNIIATSTQFVEFEYSIQASTTAQNGSNYCFRLTDAGRLLETYSLYPTLAINTDITASSTGTQVTTQNAPAANQYLGGTFIISGNSFAHTMTSVTLSETGTVNASSSLKKVRLRYDLDTSAPYNCQSESYIGTESQFGATTTFGFNAPNGTATFTGSLAASSTRSLCLYVVYETNKSVSSGETLNVQITNPTSDLVFTTGTISPTSILNISGTTTLNMATLTQTRYHWRNFNGTQATATSKTRGVENTPLTFVGFTEPVRLRMEVSNEGTHTSSSTALRLEFGNKVTTCANISSWTDVGSVGGAFDMYNSPHVTDGANTTNISNALGGVTDDNPSFKTPNAAMKDTGSKVATTTILNTELIETEFSIKENAAAGYDTTYCFRVSDNGTALKSYTTYPELTTSPERDFEIQRGTADFSGTSLTLVAGVDYVAPLASTSAFVRITNTGFTGAGDSSAGGTQNAKDVTAYISNASNIVTSFTISRPGAIATTTRVSWEIVEFIGTAGSDNEIKVRSQNSVTYGTSNITATGSAASGIVDDTDVVVFITGQQNPDTGTADYNTGLSTSRWLPATDQPAFLRGEAGADASIVSYAVVEFTGQNWKVQRVAHTYTAAGATETEPITALNSLSRTFVHAQKMSGTGLDGTDEFGHEVWLSSIGAISFMIEAGASTPGSQTSVIWIVENTQTTAGSVVVTRSNGNSTGGTNPLLISLSNGVTLSDLTNASIFTNNRSSLTTTLYPRPILGVTIASSTNYELWRSDSGSTVTYRTEIVEWPTAGLKFLQNDYQLYVDNNTLDPTDPWPVGVSNLGENTPMTGSDEPMGRDERLRIRMNLTVRNATMPALGSSFKLQFGQRVTSCTAIAGGSWTDLGTTTSSAIWRGYNAGGVSDGTALSIDPPSVGTLNLTVSDTAGTYEEENNTAPNPYLVAEDADVEYDWNVQQNGANASTTYCFRMVDNSGAALGGYLDWPQVRTSSYTPKTQNWRFYSDVNNETPTVALASENAAPIDLSSGSTTKLRITVKETENISQNNTRFKLQYSENPTFTSALDVIATSSCIASSTWCYFNGAGLDNAVISTKVLSDANTCTGGVGNGCGTHVESPSTLTGFTHVASSSTEYEFTLQAKALRANAVYYFRLFDKVQNLPVVTNISESYPSVVAVGASLSFVVSGLPSGTVIDGHTLNITSTPTTIAFGTLNFDANYNAGNRLSINTNATEGYQVLVSADGQLLNSYGSPIPPIGGTNATPAAWGNLTNGCLSSAIGCFGYHASDDILSNGSIRFQANDSFARIASSTAEEVMSSSIPINDTHDIVFRVKVSEKQPAGEYETTITYIAVPVH